MDIEVEIAHQPEKHRFVAVVDGHECLLDYEVLTSGDLDFVHTYTPSALRGQGVAGRIVAAGLDHARASGRRVVPSCPYVQAYIDRHPVYRDLIAR